MAKDELKKNAWNLEGKKSVYLSYMLFVCEIANPCRIGDTVVCLHEFLGNPTT
jgi:hypothetical protein